MDSVLSAVLAIAIFKFPLLLNYSLLWKYLLFSKFSFPLTYIFSCPGYYEQQWLWSYLTPHSSPVHFMLSQCVVSLFMLLIPLLIPSTSHMWIWGNLSSYLQLNQILPAHLYYRLLWSLSVLLLVSFYCNFSQLRMCRSTLIGWLNQGHSSVITALHKIPFFGIYFTTDFVHYWGQFLVSHINLIHSS